MVGFQRRFDAEFLRCRSFMSDRMSDSRSAHKATKAIVKVVVESRDPVRIL